MNSGSCAGVDYVIVDANAMLSVMKHVMILCIRENCFVQRKNVYYLVL